MFLLYWKQSKEDMVKYKVSFPSQKYFHLTHLSLYKLNNLFFVYISVSKSNDLACVMLTRLISDDLLIFLPLFSFAVPICLYNEGAFFFFFSLI